MLKRLSYYRQRLPHYLSHQAPQWVVDLFTRWLYHYFVPHRQDAPVIVFTMGKVGSMSLVHSLQKAGILFTRLTHTLLAKPRYYPYLPPHIVRLHHMMVFTRILHFPWLLRRPHLRILTAVREPIGRLVSLYLFAYNRRFGERLEETPLETLLENFPRVFEKDYAHPSVPGSFLTHELQSQLGIDVYQHPSPRVDGAVAIKHGNISFLIMKLEITDEQKADALSAWMEKPIQISNKNTAEDVGYAHIYEEFKRRVRIPYRYAEAIYRSSYMQHFYTPEERTKFWQRWEPQLDKSIPLPDWVEDQLQTYHPPVD